MATAKVAHSRATQNSPRPPHRRTIRSGRRAGAGVEKTGLAQIYIRWSEDFHGRLRPAYDSAPEAQAELTARQLHTLKNVIGRYLAKIGGAA